MMNRWTKRVLKIVTGGILLACGILLKIENQWLELGVFLVSYGIVGGDIVLKAVKNIFRGQVFDENFLMGIATAGAFLIGEYAEGVGVMLFYQVGEMFQGYAVEQSRKSIASLMDIRPDYANVKRGGGVLKVDPDEVVTGEMILVKPGERIPLDGQVTEGHSALDTSALTGEPAPRDVAPGSEVLSGCVNINGVLTIEVTKEYGQSTVSKILELVENAAAKKASAERFITRFARYYTPAVVILAALISIIPPLLPGGGSFAAWAYRGLTFLVISCPCALVVSIPLGFFGGIGGASKQGVLIKGGNCLEDLARLETVVFDKTGTLTKGVFRVQEIYAAKPGKSERYKALREMGEAPRAADFWSVLELAAHAEHFSRHPISLSLKKAYGKEIDNARVTDAREFPGHGVRSLVDGRTVLAGNAKLMQSEHIPYFSGELPGTAVHVAVNGHYAGYILISDEIKADAAEAIRLLKAAGIRQTALLTGDAKRAGQQAATELGLDVVYTELLPGDKVEKLEGLLAQKSPKGKLAFVGDGINDAPVLARADVGFAMGGLGSDAAIEAADVVIMTDEPSKIPAAIKISRKTLGIVKQNIIFSLGTKLAVLALAAAGFAGMWAGVLADVGVTVLAVLNAARALKTDPL